jgi:hypothetical protein
VASCTVRNTIGLTIGIGFAGALLCAAHFLTATVAEPLPAPDGMSSLAYTKPPLHVEPAFDRARAKVPRAKDARAPKPNALLFRGEYERRKACVQMPEGLAMCELNNFRVVEIVRGSEALPDRFESAHLRFSGLGRLRGNPENLIAGKTYTVRWEPSDETWGQIAAGSHSISLWSAELEIVQSIPQR